MEYIVPVCAILLLAAMAVLVFLLKNDSAKQKQILDETQKEITFLSREMQSLSKQINDEAQRSRTENTASQQMMREEISVRLKGVSEQLEKLRSSNFDHLLKLTETVNSSLNTIRLNQSEQNEKQTRVIESSIEKMQLSNEKKLDQMRETVDEKLTSTLTTRLDSSFKTVSSQLENVYKSLGEMKELSSGVTNNVTTLNRVLTNVKARGTWAEVQLESILDQTIPNMYIKNYSAKEGSREMVEFAVKIPSGENNSQITYLPIDSKFPMEDYIRLCDAADNADAQGVKTARKALEDRVFREGKEITKYIHIPDTTPFAIMYLATEGLYSEIASSRTGLPEKMQSELNIMIAGPTTITALLNSLSMGFKAVAINEKANEVRKLLAVAKVQYDKFGTLLDKTKKKIDEAGKTLTLAQDRNRLIQKKLKNIDSSDYEEETLLILSDDSDEQTEV